MAITYFRLYPGDYLRDTHHLSLTQHGAYLRLIMVYMDHGPIPNDLQRVYRLLHADSVEERAAIEAVLGEFFQLDGPVWRHRRCEREAEHLKSLSDAGKLGAEVRWKSDRNATAMRPQCIGNANQNQNQKVVEAKASMSSSDQKPGPKLDGAHRVLDHLNNLTGRKYRPVEANLRLIRARLKEGYTEAELRAVAAIKAMEWQDDDKMREFLRPATLFNREKCAQYAGKVGTFGGDDGE